MENKIKIKEDLETIDFMLNVVVNDLLCKRVDKKLLKYPNSNEVARFVDEWINKNIETL